MPANQALANVTDYIVQVVIVAYYFLYYLFKVSPSLTDSTDQSDAKSCCLHGSHEKQKQPQPTVTKPQVTKPTRTWTPVKQEPKPVVKESVFKTITSSVTNSGKAVVGAASSSTKAVANAMSSSGKAVVNAASSAATTIGTSAKAAKEKLNIFGRIKVGAVETKKEETKKQEMFQTKTVFVTSASPPAPPAVPPPPAPKVTSITRERSPVYPSGLFSSSQEQAVTTSTEKQSSRLYSGQEQITTSTQEKQSGPGYVISTSAVRSGPAPFIPKPLSQDKVTPFKETVEVTYQPGFQQPEPTWPPIIQPTAIRPTFSPPQDAMDDTISKLQHIADDSKVHKTETTFIIRPKPFLKGVAQEEEEEEQPRFTSFSALAQPAVTHEPPPPLEQPQHLYPEFVEHNHERQPSVTRVTRQWPPPSNATGAEVIKDMWMPSGARETTLSQSWHATVSSNPGHQGAVYDTVGDQVRQCQAIARTLTSPPGDRTARSRGERVFARRKDRMARLGSYEPYKSETESLFSDSDEHVSRAVRNPQGDLRDYGRMEKDYGELVTNMMSPEKSHELSRLLLETELTGGGGRGVQMFTKRRERADRWAVENAPTPTPEDVAKEEVAEVIHEAARQDVINALSDGPYEPVYYGSTSRSYREQATFSPPAHQTEFSLLTPTGVRSSVGEELRDSVRLFSPQPFHTSTPKPFESRYSPPPQYSPRSQYANIHTPSATSSIHVETFNSLPRDWKTWSQKYSQSYQ